LMPVNVGARIATVTKTQPAYDTSDAKFTQTTEDDVWTMSYAETISSGPYGSLYTAGDRYTTGVPRKKYSVNSSSADYWWLRDAYGSKQAYRVNTWGQPDGGLITEETFVCIALGFCIK